jgi:hypothetical protein
MSGGLDLTPWLNRGSFYGGAPGRSIAPGRVLAIVWTITAAAGTMAEPMRKLRLALILVLAGILDLGSGTLPGGAEVLEEFEEAAHGRRRLARLARQPAPPATDADHATTAVVRPRPPQHQPRARAAAEPARKTPAPPPDPASATDDH